MIVSANVAQLHKISFVTLGTALLLFVSIGTAMLSLVSLGTAMLSLVSPVSTVISNPSPVDNLIKLEDLSCDANYGLPCHVRHDVLQVTSVPVNIKSVKGIVTPNF